MIGYGTQCVYQLMCVWCSLLPLPSLESSPPSADSPSKWRLTDVANSRQLGSKERVTAKKALIAELCMRHHHTTATLQPQATSPSHEAHTLRETQRALRDSRQRERVLEQRAQEAERRLQEAEELTHQLQQFADASEQREQEATIRAQQHETRAQEAEEAIARVQTQLQEETTRAQLYQTQAQEATARAQQHTMEAREADERLQEIDSHWVVRQNEIQLTTEELGRGGWAAVKVAVFRGTRVAAKCFFQQIVSQYNRRLFRREMSMASRIRHPNLVQFVGATLEGEMIILTELMPTSLRAVLEQRAISLLEITTISLDVARALNYLHLMRPDPIVHRDISSANVLLEPGPNNSWKAKVSDYGSVNRLENLQTKGAGNPTYAAPEANTADQQTPKMDIFSFGVLLIEMCTDEFPETKQVNRERQIRSIPHAPFVALIHRCLHGNKVNRPSASDLITELSR